MFATNDLAQCTVRVERVGEEPGFTAVGIGANTAIFSIVNGVLLKRLAWEGAKATAFTLGREMTVGIYGILPRTIEIGIRAASRLRFGVRICYATGYYETPGLLSFYRVRRDGADCSTGGSCAYGRAILCRAGLAAI